MTDGTQMLDVAIIGSGFAGLYSLHKFRNVLGMSCLAFDDASGVAGTWTWNRYPGARSDTEVSAYTYSFDRDLYFEWKWTARYPRQEEILAYLNKVADKHDLKRSILFCTRVSKLVWNDTGKFWTVETDNGDSYTARFVIEGVGLLSSAYLPSFTNQDAYKGSVYHTARWPHSVLTSDLAGKRVGVIGTGSSGVQVVTELQDKVGELVVFQRSPQYVVPAQNRPIAPELIEHVRENWDEYWNSVLGSVTAFGFEESAVSSESVSAEERREVFERCWNAGGGFQFMFQGFSDIGTSRVGNEAACEFIRGKIKDIVKDPEVVRKLTPYDLYAKRPLCCDGYYSAYNRPNVHLVDAKATPIKRFVETGVETNDGRVWELDVVIMATGFDAVTGNYLRIETVGRDGRRLEEHWRERPRLFLGLAIAGFPNLFTVFGPLGAFTNQPPVHEAQVDYIARLVLHLRANNLRSIEPRAEAEQGWVDLCDTIAKGTLFPECNSWINSANIPGKKVAVNFYMGGCGEYMKKLRATEADGLKDYILS